MHNLNKQIHALLAQTGLTNSKADIIAGITSGRTNRSSEMNQAEAFELCMYLRGRLPQQNKTSESYEKVQKLRRKLIATAHNMNWKLPNGRADMPRINAWCLQQFGKKKLNEYTLNELPKLVSIFEIVYKQFLNKS